MINFDFYKTKGKWTLNISEGDERLSTISFDETIDNEQITSLVPILGKGDNIITTINFTRERNDERRIESRNTNRIGESD